MFAICLICWESLANVPHESLYGGRIGTVVCGHVFHVNCINKWWNQETRNYQRAMTQRHPGQPIPTLIFRCPVCRRGDNRPQVFELFFQEVEYAPGLVAAAAGPRIVQDVQDCGAFQDFVVAAEGLQAKPNDPEGGK